MDWKGRDQQGQNKPLPLGPAPTLRASGVAGGVRQGDSSAWPCPLFLGERGGCAKEKKVHERRLPRCEAAL